MTETSPKPSEEPKAEEVTTKPSEEVKQEGASPQVMSDIKKEGISDKSRLAVTLLAFFLGGLGIHRFYLGKIITGILMLLTGGGLGIWYLIDFIMAVSGTMKDKEGKFIKNW